MKKNIIYTKITDKPDIQSLNDRKDNSAIHKLTEKILADPTFGTMVKSLHNYLHLYLGQKCRCKYPYSSDAEKIVTITPVNLHELLNEVEYCYPVLRSVDSLTAPEFEEFKIVLGYPNKNATLTTVNKEYIEYTYTKSKQYNGLKSHILFTKISPEAVRFLLAKGFDIFGLIDAGIAIDKKTL